MKTVGDVLSVLFDEEFVKKAQGYKNIFESWAEITAENGIEGAAEHSRIKQLEKGILLVEMDHPGWKQLLQTKKSQILKTYQCRFPEMEITGMSLKLGKPTLPISVPSVLEYPQTDGSAEQTGFEVRDVSCEVSSEISSDISCDVSNENYDVIKDDNLREKLKKLGQAIALRDKDTN